jgi:hypothetical protein
MTWLDRLRQKNQKPSGPELTKLTKPQNGGVLSVRPEVLSVLSVRTPMHEKFFSDGGDSSVVEVLMVAYQRLSVDYDLPDGTYTPEQLQQARLRIIRGPILHYRLHWPGGTPQPIAGGLLVSR